MFFRRKKDPEPPAPPPPAPAAPVEASTQFLTGNNNIDRRSVEVLLSAIARVSESRDLESLLLYIVDTSIEITGAERGLLILADERGTLSIRVARARGKKSVTGDMRYSTSVVRRVLEEQQPVRATVTSESEALELGSSVFDLKLRAVMCVPLVSLGGETEMARERGALYVDSKAATREFRHEDLALFAALSQHISIALQNARLHAVTIEKARLEQSLVILEQIQKDLISQAPRDLPGYDVYGWYKPAEGTTGDFYDFVKMKGGRLGVVLGDATGHGAGPAVLAATAQAGLRAFLRVVDDLPQAITLLNADISPRMDDGRFLTLFTAVLEPDGRVQMINAGQTPPILWRARDGSVEHIKGHGPALGMMDEFEYTEGHATHLEPGDLLVIYSDGFAEARSISDPNSLFGESGMRSVVEGGGRDRLDAAQLVELLVKSALEFAGGRREDDMTVVVVRRHAEGGA
ncbi:MAG: SpoIIE family protein phosphatase [Planctomycetes bacterium]|nr:SpoIIE family protein phosphatase [Planctomycetota bacterium]